MLAPSIPPLHHRRDADAPSGILLDAASAPAVVAGPSRGDHATGIASHVGGGLPAITYRRLPLGTTCGERDLMRSDLDAPFSVFRSGRAVTTDVTSMSWDAEHGFRTPDAPSSTLRMVRRRRSTGSPADATASVDGGGVPGPWSLPIDQPIAQWTDQQTAGPHPAGSHSAAHHPGGHHQAELPALELRYVPAAGPRIEHPPSDLVHVVRNATGVDVSGTRIDRSADVTERAASMGALAFTDGETVHLPAELGPHDEGPTRAVLAHELVHVAQQRALGSRLPGEGTPEGIELEHQARAVQRAIDDRTPVVPTFLRTAPLPTAAPAGVQRLAPHEDRFDWQQRGTPPSERGARSVFGFGFLRPGADSAEGRERATGDRQWAHDFEADHAAALQERRNVRYAEMVTEAERALQIQNLREDGEGDAVLELERHDILALRSRLDDEMPWEFGPPPELDRLYPIEPELPAEDVPTRRSRVTQPSPVVAPFVAPAATSMPNDDDHGPKVPDAPSVGRDSVTRRTASPLRHPHGSPGAAAAEPDVTWQHRPSTAREQISAVFGGALGALLSSSVSDGDDETERRRAEAAPEVMQRRLDRESELRHVELRSLSVAARREETAGPATLGDEAIARIRARVDTEMPLEFAMPEYLDRNVDVFIDAEGTVGPTPAEVVSEQALTDDATSMASDTTDAMLDSSTDGAPESATGNSSTTLVEWTPVATPPAAATADEPMAPNIAVAAGVTLDALATHIDDDPDDRAMASRVFDAASDLDLEKLTRRLYGRFRRDLRRELLIDRERAGTLADAC